MKRLLSILTTLFSPAYVRRMARAADVITTLGESVAKLTPSSTSVRVYTDEVIALIEAAHRAYRQQPVRRLRLLPRSCRNRTSGTRAFYRHFQSKDELLLAMLEYEAELFDADLRAALAKATGTVARLECWIDRQLAVVFDRAPAARTALFERERHRLAHVYPDRTAEIQHKVREPLTDNPRGGSRRRQPSACRAGV